MKLKTNVEWRAWGARDPLYGVAVWPGRDRNGERPWTDEEFYALGADWLDFSEHWQRYGLERGVVLEIGCGAGRMTKRIAEDFTRVIACDVSEGMIEYAREKVTARNIDWRLSDGAALPAPDHSVDSVFSCHVLQHLESCDVQIRCFREIHRVLRPGGTFMVHLYLHSYPAVNPHYAMLARMAYNGYLLMAGVKAAIRRALMKLGGAAYMHGVSHEVQALDAGLREIGFGRVEFASFPVRTNGSLHTCVLGTKPQ
jgi:SAM-dependent methyltransferase